MPFIKKMRGVCDPAATEGFCKADWEATTPCQREAIGRLGTSMQLEQEAFLSQNPKIRYMLKTYFGKVVSAGKSRESLKDAAAKILELCDQIDQNPTPESSDEKPMFTYKDNDLEIDLKNVYKKHYPTPSSENRSTALPTPNTMSSSFISIVTSETTLPTPEKVISLPVSDARFELSSSSSAAKAEDTSSNLASETGGLITFSEPIPTPEPTLSELMMQVVSNTVDKAIYGQVNEAALRYDTAYVELTKAVEEAMEIPVTEIRADIAELFFCAYRMFELNIIEKERIAAEIAWEKRMRKKLKRTLRRLHNFKGYETPPTPKSEISSHESYKIPPPRPCVCHPQFHYNRYPKDRFGIYLPRREEFSNESVTVPLVFAEEETKSDEEGSCKAVA